MSGGTGSTHPLPPVALDARGLPVGYPLKAEWEVTPREAAIALKSAGGPLLVDCRRADEHAFCHVAGGVLVPMDQTVARADEIEEAAGGKGGAIIVMCHHGRRSIQVTATLRGLGFTKVKSMAAGIDGWSLSVDPEIKRY
jgi:rhodanese-related sulfurtransferase